MIKASTDVITNSERNAKTLLFSRVFVAFPAGFEPTIYRLGGGCVLLYATETFLAEFDYTISFLV